MGVQILNKDVSVISSIANVAKASIGNVGGIVGWAGGGDVTPNPTPDWGGYYESELPVNSSTIQVLGINTPITLSINITNNDGGTLNVGVNTSNSYGGNITLLSDATNPTNNTFIVNANNYVTFRWTNANPAWLISFNVINNSDGNAQLGNEVALARIFI